MREDGAQGAGFVEQKEAQRERRRSSDSSAEDDRVRRNEKHERRERKWSREEHRNPADEAAELFKDVDRGPFLRVDKRGNGRGWSPFAAQRAAGGGRYTWLQRKVTFSSRIFSSGAEHDTPGPLSQLPSLVKITLDGADLVSSSPRARRTQKREDSAPVNDTKFENIRNTSVDNANQGGACGGCGLEALQMPSHS